MSAARVNWLEILCLANSRKIGGCCVAGVRLDTREWVRPVTNHPYGSVHPTERTLDSGRDVALLDVARIPIDGPVPKPMQPENLLLAAGTWRYVRTLNRHQAEAILQPLINPGPELLGSRSDRVDADNAQPVSLGLVEPEDLRWHVTRNHMGARQLRASFVCAGQPYDLVVTDPLWEAATSGLPPGFHPKTAAGTRESDRILFTLSLAEPIFGYCYKLVAAVVRLR